MTDEAHAKSSVSTSSVAGGATTPGEQDYAAIHDTFMETTRGRWFLAEFAKRNRNADIRMVLDAVARIEHSLAPAKDAPADLTGMIAAIGDVVAQAKRQAETALQEQPAADRLAVAYRSIRAIREIAWTLREVGSEGSICDRLDAHASAIDRSLDQLATAAPGDAVAAIFDDLIAHLDAFASGEYSTTPAAPPEAAVAFSSEAPETMTAPPAPTAAIVAAPEPAAAITATPVENHAPDAEPTIAASIMSEAAIAEAEEADDLAVLDMIAREMGAPTSEADDDVIDGGVSDADVNDNPEAIGEAFDLRKDSPASLGAALLASGAIRPRSLTGAGRFAAIQRLSQAEKVALFS